MKAQSYNKLPVFFNIGNGKTHYNYNETEKEIEQPDGEKVTIYEYDQVTIQGEVNRESMIDAVIRERYSINEELAVQRQRDSKPKEFESYNDFCESVKEQVRMDFDIKE